jgi:nitroreductase
MEINKAIQNRWSPHSFSAKEVTKEMIELLFEAARRAPSSMNEQPWKYYFVHRNNLKKFSEAVELLTGNNPEWRNTRRF